MAKTYKTSILSVYDENGNKIPIPAIKGKDGQLKPLFAESKEWLEKNGDTSLVYILPDGFIYAYIGKEVEGGTTPNFTNDLLSSEDIASSAVFNGIGYITGNYLTSSAPFYKISTIASDWATGYIPYTVNTPIYIKGVSFTTASHDRMFFFSDKNTRINPTINSGDAITTYFTVKQIDDYYKLTPLSSPDWSEDTRYVRMGFTTGNPSEAIISVGNPITYTTTESRIVYEWKNTGHAFVNTDYEPSVDDMLAYVVEEAEKVADAVQAVRTSKTLVFSAMSDIHVKDGSTEEDHINSLTSLKSAGMGLKEIQKRIDLDFIALLGDYSYMSSSNYSVAQTKKDILLVKKTLGLNKDKEIWCIGNHDWCYGTGVDRMLTEDELYGYIGANSEGVKPYESIERCYGYVDFDNQKIRAIYLNTNDCKDGIDNGAVTKEIYSYMEMISPTQLRWLADVALDFTDKANSAEWGVVILSHQPIDYGFGWYKIALQILEAYRDKAKLENVWVTDYILKDYNGEGQHKYVTHAETFDFTGVENPAEIICNVHGHLHNCAYAKTSSADTITPWLWRFCVPNMCDGRYNEKYTSKWGEVDKNGEQVKHTKVIGTADETSFNIVSIDRKNKKIYAHIFGAGVDRIMSYAEGYVPQTFAITTNLANCVGASGNASTIVEDGTVTLTFTANDGYKLPEIVTVTGANYTWNVTEGALTLSVPTSEVSISILATSLNLFSVAREYSTTPSSDNYLANTDARELDFSKYYAVKYSGERGSYVDAKLISHSMLPDINGFKYQVNSTTGYGLEFPIPISGGKTYELQYTSTANTPDVWLVQYNNDTSFNKITKIKNAITQAGDEYINTFATESGYLYSLAFTMSVNNADVSAVNISLKEKT